MTRMQQLTMGVVIGKVFASDHPMDGVEEILKMIVDQAAKTFYEDNRLTQDEWIRERLEMVLLRRHN